MNNMNNVWKNMIDIICIIWLTCVIKQVLYINFIMNLIHFIDKGLRCKNTCYILIYLQYLHDILMNKSYRCSAHPCFTQCVVYSAPPVTTPKSAVYKVCSAHPYITWLESDLSDVQCTSCAVHLLMKIRTGVHYTRVHYTRCAVSPASPGGCSQPLIFFEI